MKNSLPYQFVADLVSAFDRHNLPSFLKKITKEKDISNFEKLEEFFEYELTNASFQNQQEIDYFLFIAGQVLRYYFLKRDFSDFQEKVEKLKHRMMALKNVKGEANLQAWEVFIGFLECSFLRLVKHVTIEEFEKCIDEIEWDTLDQNFIANVSMAIGFVYLNESNTEQSSKSRLWLSKSIADNPDPANLGSFLLLSEYYLQNPTSDNIEQVRKIIEKLSSLDISENLTPLFAAAAFELEATLMSIETFNFDDEETQLSHCESQIKTLTERVKALDEALNFPTFTQHYLSYMVASLHARRYQISEEGQKTTEFVDQMDEVIKQVKETHDASGEMFYRIAKAELAARAGYPQSEKDFKEVVKSFKKSLDYPTYIKSQSILSRLYANNGHPEKANGIILETLKLGEKRIEEGGFYLTTKGLALANEVFLAEARKPGISWMIDDLNKFFDLIAEVIDNIEKNIEVTGKSEVEEFRDEFIRFEPVSHFNIKTYFKYQFYSIKLIRIGAMIQGDKAGITLVEKLIRHLENDNNPLSFIKADWDDYKLVPNSVRNKTLNKAINISKGDLPLAAEHLDFSYRNLRSYITFKEVNRLGFFLDNQETNNKQLEQGIRLMFFDLYKKGTIFEVVFDMPKFLVNHAQSGFFSQDLEVALNIKGTTAKKYIKIMMEINLIRQDKTLGRKHFYHLNVDKAMKRLGQDQATLMKSD